MSSSQQGIRYNVKKFHYVDRTQVRLYSIPLVKGLEKKKKKSDDEKINDEEISEEQKLWNKFHSIKNSTNRTVQKMYAITRANKWDWFITFTFDRNIIDSSDYDLVSRVCRKWCNHLKERVAPNMRYILVPELHSDHVHWHIHGLLADCQEIAFIESDVVKNGKMIYNVGNWKYGFSTASVVESTGKVSAYITKYITKDLCERSKGKRRYWASSNCLRAEDVCEVDLITEEEKSALMHEICDRIQHLKQQSCSKSGQTVKYIELEKLNGSL